MSIQRLAFAVLLSACLCASAADDNFAELDLATLMTMDVTITSAAKHAQLSADAAAAVYVLTREDIRRSGASSIPEVLRLVPGLQVARVSTRSWSISARGSSSRFANKLLVMIDGRSIYTAIFSGIIWEEQPMPLDNIERIEVIRGPGGALWGINAVNGVINIITRHAADQPGVQLAAERGDDQQQFGVRYAGANETAGDYRVYLDSYQADALDGRDTDVQRVHGGWRLDRSAFGGAMTFAGEITDADFSEYDGLPDSAYHRYATGGAVLLDWRKAMALGQLELRAAHNIMERSQPGQWDENVTGLDAQFSAQRIGRHRVTGGVGYRRIADRQRGYIPALSLAKSECVHDQWSVYAQDEAHFLDDAARLIVGAKLEHFESTGLAFQPTVRGLWKVNDRHTVWSAASRALRAPSRFEMHSQVESQVQTQPLPVIVRMTGDADLDAEELIAYEAGWRWRPHDALAFDTALYQNEYDGVIGAYEMDPIMQFDGRLYLLVPIAYANAIDARARGVEWTAQWQPFTGLRLEATAALYDVHVSRYGGNITTRTGNIDPEEAYRVGLRWDPLRDVELDLGWRYASALRGLGVAAYDALDARIAWQVSPSLELSLSVLNALGGTHREMVDEQAGQETVVLERTGFVRINWRPGR